MYYMCLDFDVYGGEVPLSSSSNRKSGLAKYTFPKGNDTISPCCTSGSAMISCSDIYKQDIDFNILPCFPS